MALSKAILLAVLATLTSALPRPTHWEPGPDDYNDPLALKGSAPDALLYDPRRPYSGAFHDPRRPFLPIGSDIDFELPTTSINVASVVPTSSVVTKVVTESVVLTVSAPSVPVVDVTATTLATTLANVDTPVTTTLVFPMTSAPGYGSYKLSARSESFPPPDTCVTHLLGTATSLFARDIPLVDDAGLERNIAYLHYTMATDERRLKEQNATAQQWEAFEEEVRNNEAMISQLRADEYDNVMLMLATAVKEVIVETKEGVPTTMTTVFAKPRETEVVEERWCPTWGCDGMPCMGDDCFDHGRPIPRPNPIPEPPCMGDDCFDDGLPLPPAPVPMPGPRPFPPGRPHPPRPILCDGPGCELPREDLRCVDLLDCQPPIDQPACMTTDCGKPKVDAHIPKDPVYDAGTGPMDAQQE